MRALLLTTILLTGCGARTGLGVEELEGDGDAGPDSGPDAGADGGSDAGVFVCEEEPCDCFAGGSVAWSDVRVCATRFGDVPGVYSCGEDGDRFVSWGSTVWVEAHCPGRYRFCAELRSGDGSCVVTERCGEATLRTADGRTRLLVPNTGIRSNACADRASMETGVDVCARIEWTSSGGRGEVDLGCFARFGPWCWADCGGGGSSDRTPPPGAGGEWEF